MKTNLFPQNQIVTPISDLKSLYPIVLKSLFTVILLFLSVFGWGQTTATYTFSVLGGSNITNPSGNIDSNISYTSAQNSGTTGATYQAAGLDLRLYYQSNGNAAGSSINLTANNGVTITGIEFETVSTTYIPTMRYSIGAAAFTASDPTMALSNTTYSVSGLSITSSVKIRNANTGNTQMRMMSIKVTYTGGGPTITSATTSLTGFSATPSTPSAQQTFNVSGSALTNNISVSPSTNYEISATSGSGFTSSAIPLTQTGGTVATTPIYVRLKSGLALGAYNGEIINITSTGASAKTVTLSGDVVRKTVTSTTSGDWNSGTTWVGGVAPTSADNVVIAATHTVSAAAAVTRDTNTTTTVNGSFQLNNGGYAGGQAFTYAATGSGLIFNSGAVYDINAGNAFWPTTAPPFNVTVNSGSGARTNTAVGAVAGILTLNGQFDASTAIAINGTLQINAGGYISANAPGYGSASTLLYNSNFGVGTEWPTTGTTAGAGIPNNVTIQNNAAVTYSAGSARGMAGNLSIASGSSLTSGDILNIKGTTTNAGTLTTNSTGNFTGAVTNSGTFNSNGVSNLAGNFSNSGTTAALNLGGDFNLAGNWSNAGNFTPNSKAVFFNGATGTQTITNTNAANSNSETFAYLINNKAAGTLSIASNVNISGTAGDVFQIITDAATSLNGANRTLTFNGSGGNILVSGAARTITGTASTAAIVINGTKTVRSTSGGTLVLGTNITTKLSNGINFGAGLTTVANVLEVNNGGFVDTNPPVYASTSTLTYNTGGSYGVNNEWTGNATAAAAGIPQNVTISGNTTVNMPSTIRGLAGNLTIGGGSTLSLNTTLGADLAIGGNFTNSGVFTPNSRAVIFNGDGTAASPQRINSATTFDYLTINASSTNYVQLFANIIVNRDLTLTNKSISLTTFNLTLPNKSSVITSNANSYINAGGTGRLIRQNIDNTADWVFPMGVALAGRYAPITIKNLSGTTEIGVRVSNTLSPAVADATKVLKTEWFATTTNNVTANIYAEWQGAIEQGASMSIPEASGQMGVAIGTSPYTLYNASIVASNTIANSVSLSNTNSNAIVIGNSDAISISNDECSGAKSVIVDDPGIIGKTTGATRSLLPTCGGTNAANDVWYKFTTTDAGDYRIDVAGSGSFDAVLELRSGACNGISIACVDDTASAGLESITAALAASTTYYYRIYHYYVASISDSFTTSVTSIPNLVVTPTTLAFGDVVLNTSSANQSISVGGSLLKPATGNINLASVTGYQYSLTGTSGWVNTLALPYTARTLATTTVYVRLTPTAGCTDYNGSIAISGGGATTVNVALTGRGIIAAAVASAGTDIIDTSFTANWNVVNGATGYELEVSKSPTFGTASSSTLTEGFNGGITAPSGWVFTAIGGTYSSAGNFGVTAPSLQFDNTSDQVVTPVLSGTATELKFWIKGQGTNAASALLVEGYNGSSWVTIQNITNSIPLPATTYTYNSSSPIVLPANLTQFRFTYTKSNGNLAFDDVSIIYDSSTPDFVTGYAPKIISGGSTISSSVTGLEAGTQYYYRVRAVTGTCKSANSNVINVLTDNKVTWNGTAWSNGTGPTANLEATIRGPFVTGVAPQNDFTAKKLTIATGGSVQITADHYIKVINELVNNLTVAEFVVESDGNFWQTTSATNTGEITVKRNITRKDGDQYNYLISPTVGTNLKTNIYGTGNSAPLTLFHIERNNTFGNSIGTYIKGRGLAVKEPASASGSSTAIFKGVPMNEAFSFNLLNSNVNGGTTLGYNLTGNPYPSNIDLNKLYNLNTNKNKISATFYFWDNTVNSATTQGGTNYNGAAYAVFNAVAGSTGTGLGAGSLNGGTVTGTKEPTRVVKTGQGFMVKSIAVNNSSLDFNNDIRIADAGVFFGKNGKAESTDDRFYLKLTAPTNVTTQSVVVYFEGGIDTFAADDSEIIGNPSDLIYTLIGNQKAIINGRAPFVNTDRIPLGSNSFATGTYVFSLGTKEGTFANGQNIYLKDNQTGTLTNLSEGNYSFTANAGESTGRFEIVYKPETVLATDGNANEELVVYKDSGDFVVKAQSKKITDLQVFDMNGRLIYSAKPNAVKVTVPAAQLVNGTYLLKIDQGGKLSTKKVIR